MDSAAPRPDSLHIYVPNPDPPIARVRRRADTVFIGARTAVFVDGWFWHGCPVHATWPVANRDWWRTKLESNRRRNLNTTQTLSTAGWAIMRFWEHDSRSESAMQIEAIVRARVGNKSSPITSTPNHRIQ